jgi:hypothetical protein
MSTEQHNIGHGASHGNAHAGSHGGNGEPRHDTVAFEVRDVKVRAIYWYLFSLAVATIFAFGSAVVILRVTTKMVVDADAPMLPIRKAMSEKQKMEHAYPPEPRLQGVPGHELDAQQDLRNKVRDDTQANNELRWVDQNSGIAQIPVSEAMRLIVERGVHANAPTAKSAEAAKTAVESNSAVAEKTN